MTDIVDNLESLTNAELRLKCIENGMPNVAVVDSSRNVIIKRLRGIMKGGVTASPKKQNKRYTITAESPAVEVASETATKRANRRTIAVTKPLDAFDVETVKEQEETAPAPATAPIINRRRSSQRETSVQKVVPVVRKQQPIIEIDDDEVELIENTDTKPRSRNTRGASLSKSNIPVLATKDTMPIIEEKETLPTVRERTSRSVSLSKTSVVTTSIGSTAPTILEEPELNISPVKQLYTETYNKYEPKVAEPIVERNTYKESFLPSVATKRHTMLPTTSIFSSTSTSTTKYNTPTRYSSIGTPSAQVGKAHAYYNENSDDTDADAEPYNTPYLSDFARNLERLKAEPLLRRSTAGAYGTPGSDTTARYRRPRLQDMQPKAQQYSIRNSLLDLAQALDHKYNIRRNAALLLAVTAILCLFYFFWR